MPETCRADATAQLTRSMHRTLDFRRVNGLQYRNRNIITRDTWQKHRITHCGNIEIDIAVFEQRLSIVWTNHSKLNESEYYWNSHFVVGMLYLCVLFPYFNIHLHRRLLCFIHNFPWNKHTHTKSHTKREVIKNCTNMKKHTTSTTAATTKTESEQWTIINYAREYNNSWKRTNLLILLVFPRSGWIVLIARATSFCRFASYLIFFFAFCWCKHAHADTLCSTGWVRFWCAITGAGSAWVHWPERRWSKRGRLHFLFILVLHNLFIYSKSKCEFFFSNTFIGCCRTKNYKQKINMKEKQTTERGRLCKGVNTEAGRYMCKMHR